MLNRSVALFFLILGIALPTCCGQDPGTPVPISDADAAAPPSQQIAAFYGVARSLLTDSLQSVRVSGRGWMLKKEYRKRYRSAVEKALATREVFTKEAAEMEQLDDDFWDRVVKAEVAAELSLSALLSEVLTIEEQKAFYIENAKELSGAVFYSDTFAVLAELQDKQRNAMVKGLEISSRRRAEMVARPLSDRRGMQPANFVGGLSVRQLEVLFILQARMDEGMTLREYFELASERERAYFARVNVAARRLMESMNLYSGQ